MKNKEKYDIKDLLSLVKILRSSGGCSWDRTKTHESLRTRLVKETYEAVEAIDLCDSDRLKDKLGELLFQVVLHTCIEDEAKSFNFQDVVNAICKKLLIGHYHMFYDDFEDEEQKTVDLWYKLKLNRLKNQKATKHVNSLLPKFVENSRDFPLKKEPSSNVFHLHDANREL